MPNKYSHAIVLSNYESYGLTDFERIRPSRTASTSTRSTARPVEAQSTPSYPRPSICPTGQRLRLSSPSRGRSQKTRPPLHRKTSSVETQIYAPQHDPTSLPTRKKDNAKVNEPQTPPSGQKKHGNGVGSIDDDVSSIIQSYTMRESDAPRCSPRPSITKRNSDSPYSQLHRPTHQRHSSFQQSPKKSDELSVRIRDFASPQETQAEQTSKSTPSPAKISQEQTHASPGVIRTSTIGANDRSKVRQKGIQALQMPNDRYGRVPFEAHAFAPTRPPSPPATPESDRSFSLETPIEKPDPITSPPPIPERSARRTPPGPSPESQSPTTSVLRVPNEPSRPNTSPAQSTPRSPTGATFSISTRTSSLNASTSTRLSNTFVSLPSEPSFGEELAPEPSPRLSDASSKAFEVDDTDLESLPSTFAPSSPRLDFAIEPWNDENMSPAIFRDGELNSQLSMYRTGSTRASSFDSAAPPPISLNRRIPSVLAAPPSSITPRAPRTHRKSRTSMASLAFFRTAPKAILYTQTAEGNPPIAVAVSRTAAPSIPALFPGYKGPFPPLPKTEERTGRASRDSSTARQSRGRSVPPRSSDRRKSWFKGEVYSRPIGSSLSVQSSAGDTEQLVKNITALGLH